MKSKNIYCFIDFLLLLTLNRAYGIERNDVVSYARGYAEYSWMVIRTNPKYAIYDSSGRIIVGEAYSYGDKASCSVFGEEILDSLIPRNWKSNLNDSTQRLFTGIDCSGLVTRSWFFSNYNVVMVNASGLYNYTIPVVGKVKPGDIWWSDEHVFLQSSDTTRVYEANPTDNPNGGQRVQYWKKSTSGYFSRTIFPQFSAMTPKPDSTAKTAKSITIQVIAEGTVKKTGVDSRIDNAYMWLDGNAVTPTVKALNGKVYRKSITYKWPNPTPGKHRVKVQCSNVVNGIAYEDTVAWSFRYGVPEWYECNDNINGDKAYTLVTGTGYSLCNLMPTPQWVWTGKLRNVDTLKTVYFKGIQDSPYWVNNYGDTINPWYGNSQPYIIPVINGSYLISVDGTTVASVYGVHGYQESSLNPGCYFNYVSLSPAMAGNLPLVNPQQVTISYSPPIWPSNIQVNDSTYLNYIGSVGVVHSQGTSGALTAYATDNMLIKWGGKTKDGEVVALEDSLETFEESKVSLRPTFHLGQNVPNPCRSRTEISFSIPEDSEIILSVYNLNGQLVRRLEKGMAVRGHHVVSWDGRNEQGIKVVQGVYLYRLEAGAQSVTKKMIWLK